MITPFKGYTFVIKRGGTDIQLFDRNCEELTEFNPLASTMIFDLPNLASEVSITSRQKEKEPPYDKICTNFLNHKSKLDGYIHVDSLKPEFVELVRGILARRRLNQIDATHAWQLESKDPQKIRVEASGDEIVFFENTTDSSIGYKSVNKAGVNLSPGKWKRLTNVGVVLETAEAEILVLHDRALANKEGKVEDVAGSFRAAVYGGGVRILKDDDRVLFDNKIAGVGKNLCVDPTNKAVFYYLPQDAPRQLFRVTTEGDSNTWKPESVSLPEKYNEVKSLSLDPTGMVFILGTDKGAVFLAKDTMTEVGSLPNVFEAQFGIGGKIHGVNSQGNLVIYETEIEDLRKRLEATRIARMARGINVEDLFKDEFQPTAKVSVKTREHLDPIKQQFEQSFGERVNQILKFEDAGKASQVLIKLRLQLKSQGLKQEEIDFVTSDIQSSILGKQKELAMPVAAQGLADIGSKLAGNLTINLLSEAREDLARLKSLEGFVDAQTREKIIALEKQLGEKSSELFKTQGEVIGKDVDDLVEGVRGELNQMDNALKFADWEEFTLPQLVGKLGALARDCPIEAHELQQRILDARRELQNIDREYGIRFKEKYAVVREQASATMTATAELMQVDVNSFVNRFRERGLKDRSQANVYIEGSESLKLLRQEIADLKSKNPDAAKELERSLSAQIALVMSEIERRGSTTVAQTGQQMILFGQTEFPRWEGKVHEHAKRQVDVVFIPDEKTKGPGVAADKILGDVGIMEIGSTGKVQRRRLYEGMNNENQWRYGEASYRGEDVFPAYLSNAEFRQIKKDYADWSKGDASGLRKQLGEKRKALMDVYETRQKVGKRDVADEQWRETYKKSLAEYAKFAQEHHILLLSRIDQVRNAPETEFANGSGYVPGWQSHWVTDEQTEEYLEKMAKYSRMQLDLQDGLLNLRGHAGTGKDVLVKMFSNRTNRPYFTTDCSKWTTEFELSEDVILEAEDGASKTVKVPSVALNAITTPGAIMYFNEINAMPEQAQIFLHGLMDEKRTLTLKTSSGKAIRALNSVVLMGSMNPGYPGTFNPGFATKSRMMDLEIDYPPLYKEKDNPNSPISVSEALRIARGVDSLSDFTYEANPQHNEFVKIWDRYVNGVQNGAPELTKVQEFDVNVILSLVQFGNKLREGFILKFEKAGGMATKGKLLVDQPISGREMRRCAYWLSKMPESTKIIANPEQVARDLLSELFLSHIYQKTERETIETAMRTWTSSKKVASH